LRSRKRTMRSRQPTPFKLRTTHRNWKWYTMASGGNSMRTSRTALPPFAVNLRPPVSSLLFLILLCVASLVLFPAFGFAADIYIAQKPAGSGTGADCADALPYTFFNTAANWGTAAGQIGPGTTVHLCGVISSELTAHGSGAPGSPVTILFEPDAKISLPVCDGYGCLNLAGNSYLAVDGGTNGIIENTANGTAFGGTGNHAVGLNFYGSDITIENLTVQNIYVHTSAKDTNGDGTYCLKDSTKLLSNIAIKKNTIHDCDFGIGLGWTGGSPSGLTVSGNNIYRVNWGMYLASAGGEYSDIVISHNHFHDFSNWDTTTDSFHHDGIHFYASSSSTISNMTFDDNLFDGIVGADTTAWIYSEGSESISNSIFFNNVLISSQPDGNGVLSLDVPGPGVELINNTIISTYVPGGPVQGECLQIHGLTGATVLNNAMSSCGEAVSTTTGTTFTSFDYNTYANIAGAGWYYNTGFEPTLSDWQSACGCDTHSTYNAGAGLNVDGTPQSGSPATRAGENLTGMGITGLDFDMVGIPRPQTGAWDTGAFVVPALANSPKSLRVVKVH